MNAKSLVGRLSMLASVSAAAVVLTTAGASAQETVKIGGVASITGSGASVGASSVTGWKLAIDEINAAGGILGKKVELVLGDTTTDPTHAVSEVRRLIENENVQLLIGPVTSQETIPVTAVTTEKKIPEVSTAASTQLTPEFAPYHFSTSPTGVNQMRANIDFAIDKLKLSKIGLISDNGGMSKAAVGEIVDYMKSRGVEPVIVQEFPFHAEDITPQLLSMRSAGAEAILLINSIGDDSRKLLENREDIGWEAPVLANMTMTNYAVGNEKILGADAFKDVYSTQFEGMTYCPGDPVGQSPYSKFKTMATEKVPDVDRMGGASSLNPFYIEPLILAAAVNGAGTLDGPTVAKWIEENADQIKVQIGKLAASSTNHFLPSPDGVKVVTKPYELREDGLTQRADCAM